MGIWNYYLYGERGRKKGREEEKRREEGRRQSRCEVRLSVRKGIGSMGRLMSGFYKERKIACTILCMYGWMMAMG